MQEAGDDGAPSLTNTLPPAPPGGQADGQRADGFGASRPRTRSRRGIGHGLRLDVAAKRWPPRDDCRLVSDDAADGAGPAGSGTARPAFWCCRVSRRSQSAAANAPARSRSQTRARPASAPLRLPDSRPTHLPICLSAYLPIRPCAALRTVHQRVQANAATRRLRRSLPATYLPIYLSTYLPICLSAHLLILRSESDDGYGSV